MCHSDRHGKTAEAFLWAAAAKTSHLESSAWPRLRSQVRGCSWRGGKNTVIGAYRRSHGLPTGKRKGSICLQMNLLTGTEPNLNDITTVSSQNAWPVRNIHTGSHVWLSSLTPRCCSTKVHQLYVTSLKTVCCYFFFLYFFFSVFVCTLRTNFKDKFHHLSY